MRFSAKDVDNVPQGKNREDLIKIYTSNDLKIASAENANDGDFIIYKESVYQLIRKENWDDFKSGANIDHFKYVAQLDKTKK